MKYQLLRQELDNYELVSSQLIENIKAALLKEALIIFDKSPALQSVSWTQYIPFFNDGDICEFSAHCDEWGLLINDAAEEVYAIMRNPSHQLYAATKEILALLASIPNKTYEDLFGNSVKVIITTKGIEVSDYYSHD